MAPAPNRNKELIKAQKATYEVTKPLATGTFGSIYKAKRESDGKFFAVKCESLRMKHSLLRQASNVLASFQYPSQHFATIEERGTVPARFLFIVMPLYGENLSDLMINSCRDRKFSTSSALHLAEQTLQAIRDLHRNGFVHRDIKPTHFCIGREEEDLHHNVFMIDFGLCKRPRFKRGDEADEKLRRGAILYRGVVRYASLSAHQGKDIGFKDDLESWWYMVLEFFLGTLPWALMSKQNEKDVVNMKSNLSESMIFHVWKINKEACAAFFDFLTTIRSVNDIGEYVDYNRIHEGLKVMFERSNAKMQEPPDWDCLADYKGPTFQPVIMTAPPENLQLKEGAEFSGTEAVGIKDPEGPPAAGKGGASTYQKVQGSGEAIPPPPPPKTKGKKKKSKNNTKGKTRKTVTED